MNRRIVILILTLFVNLSMAYFFLVSRTHESIPGATNMELFGRCDLVLIDTRLQPFNTLVLNCSGVDSIRLWPSPIQQPWAEDWWEKKPDMLIG
jgi:hypothetical protein